MYPWPAAHAKRHRHVPLHPLLSAAGSGTPIRAYRAPYCRLPINLERWRASRKTTASRGSQGSPAPAPCVAIRRGRLLLLRRDADNLLLGHLLQQHGAAMLLRKVLHPRPARARAQPGAAIVVLLASTVVSEALRTAALPPRVYAPVSAETWCTSAVDSSAQLSARRRTPGQSQLEPKPEEAKAKPKSRGFLA
ncbi:hypothetical protein K438DRAFT_1978356 [Mycena galopus ATCC 62051]|nr:hypothetical protein K438DRAFT_1978356 [Mycena galopus ATCC 62051]